MLLRILDLQPFVGIGFSIALAFINAAILILYGEYLASFFNPNNLIVSLASTLLIVAAIFQITDGIAFSGMGALRGYKDTRVPLYNDNSVLGRRYAAWLQHIVNR